MSTRLPSLALTALALALALGAAAQDPVPDGGGAADATSFVRVVGDRFVRGGSAFRFIGANVAVMHGQAHRAAVASTLDAVRDDGLSVIRIWALGERDAATPEWGRTYAFRMGEEGWVEDSFLHLDRVLALAAERHLGVIIVLANRWADYGGLPQYLRWSEDPFDADAPDGLARAELGTFFHSARAQALYLAHVERVIGRVNTITGRPYADDPTIFAWELVNEISAERRDAGALAAFVSTSARRIHALDPRHLVSAGHIGYVTAAERRTWREIESLPEVDFADAHAYPTEHDRVRTIAELDAFVDDHAMLAHAVLHKPLVLGEVGFSTGARALHRSRASLFDHFLERANTMGVDGVLPWIYAPSTDHAGRHTILADHPDADSRRVRAVLEERARSFASTVLPREWPSSDAPLWDPSRTVRGVRRPARPSREGRVTFAPTDFSDARFESVGAYDGGAIAHVYGGGYGFVVFRFRAPRALGSTIQISMRASSELPGRGEGAQPSDGSRVLVSIDDRALGAIEVPPDDGVGRRVSLELPIDDALRATLTESTVHTLRFEVPDDDTSHGLCLYAGPTGLVELEPALRAEMPGHVEIAFLP